MRSLIVLAAALLPLASAHFNMLTPPVDGFSDSNEDKAPCGGVNLDFTNPKTNFHVGGDAIAIKSTHSQANWLYRGSLENNASPTKWVRLFPIIMQGGIGNLCEPSIPVPASWAGKKGVISAVTNGPDGMLYQCAAVNFVAGVGTKPDVCTNSTSLQVSFVGDAQLEALAGVDDGSIGGAATGGGSNGTTTSGNTPTPTGGTAPAATTSKPSGASRLVGGNGVAALVMVLLGAVYAL